MNLSDELNKKLNIEELSKLSQYIANSELLGLDKQNTKSIFISRAKSECAFYKSKEMDTVSSYKPISRLVDFEKWNKNAK